MKNVALSVGRVLTRHVGLKSDLPINIGQAVLILLLSSSAAQAAPFAGGHAENGKKLFAQYECSSCHEGKVGGDGSAIFTRSNRRVTSSKNLVSQIEQCSGAIGANLSTQEKQDLAAHLNQTYYKFK
ncbi:MAG: cytochrome c [Sideroxydans sp.]|nr:cytochrome c [Sideroxydans sp.]